MVDTVVLSLDLGQFTIPKSSYDRFTPSAKGIFEPPYYSFGYKKHFKCVLNPSSDDKKRGKYLPRITLNKAVRAGGFSTFLTVEFSAPKILFNNNFDELTDDDFDKLCTKLAHKMRYMGVWIFENFLREARVTAIHYSKNIVLTDYTTASSVITDLSKVDVSKRKNVAEKMFKNDGTALYLYTNTRSLIAYDKISELNKAKRTGKGLKEKDYYCQLSLLEDSPIKKPLEVLRLEARYLNKKTINTLMRQCSVILPAYPTFKDYFSADIAKKALLFEFEQIKEKDLGLNKSKARCSADFIVDVRRQNPGITFNKLMQIVGLKALLDETDSREIRQITGASNNQWCRLIKDASGIKFQKMNHDGFKTIESQLTSFNPIKLSDYERGM